MTEAAEHARRRREHSAQDELFVSYMHGLYENQPRERTVQLRCDHHLYRPGLDGECERRQKLRLIRLVGERGAGCAAEPNQSAADRPSST